MSERPLVLLCEDEPQIVRAEGRAPRRRPTLLSDVGGPAYADDTQTLRTHIARLRRKLEPAGADGPRHIRTDPGVRYRFVA